MLTSNVFMRVEDPHTTLDNVDTETLNKALMTKDKTEGPSTLTFMDQPKIMVALKDLLADVAYYCCYHNLLKHMCLVDTHVLAKKGKLSKRFLNAHSTPP